MQTHIVRLPTLTAGPLIMLAGALLAATPAHAREAIELQGKGVQVYQCQGPSGSLAWHLTGPEATLSTSDGQVVGRHFAGPTWQASDGSTVVGEAVASSDGAAGAVPWLVLRAKAQTGDGLFSAVSYVVRSHTVGGIPPADGCDQAHAGTEVRVDYSATYTFFPTKPPARP